MTTRPVLGFQRRGAGAPMLLLHGNGHRRQMWQPVLDPLAERFDVLAVDLPGFGESPPLPPGKEPTPDALADRLEMLMNDLGWDAAHLVGNSLGGWLALELARRGRARSVTALMPAGLWQAGHGSDSLRHRTLFTYWRTLAHLPGSPAAVRSRALRTAALAGAFGRPWKIPASVASGDVLNLRSCDMTRTMNALAGRRFTGGATIDVPVTVTLGTRDPLIRRRDLDLNQVPAQTAIVTISEVGHVPTWDDPDAITSIITDTACRNREAAAAAPTAH